MFKWLITLIVHIILLMSIFDIHFKSPIVHNVPLQCEGKVKPTASRLVIFITDGLRADLLYNITAYHKRNETYFLRRIMEEQGSWGVSHSRMPTKSRPGVVATLGGFFEDPSSVLKLFYENPVEFDHIFNHAKQTFYFGFPGMPDYFSKSQSTKLWIKHTFDDLWEGITTKSNSSILDAWVFDHVEEMFKSAEKNTALQNLLAKEKIIFCLHLAGIDLVSHIWRKITKEVIENVNVVDDGVARVNAIFDNFYNDSNTAFILTSDHGMTDWGTHGGGTPEETEVPFLAWGAGVIKEKSHKGATSVQSPSLWRAENLTRKDINQVDAAPMISTLLGMPIPVNSVGVLPRAYLDIGENDKSVAVMCNALQLLALCDKMGETIRSGMIPELKKGNPLPELLSETYKTKLNTLYKQAEFSDLLEVSEEVIKTSQLALNFYQSYYKNMLLYALCFAFIGWSMVLITSIISYFDIYEDESGKEDVKNSEMEEAYSPSLSSIEKFYGSFKFQMTVFRNSYNIYLVLCDIACLLLLATSCILIHVENWPCQFNAYLMLPILLWWWVFRQYKIWIRCFSSFTVRQHFRILICALGCMASTAYIIFSINNRQGIVWALIGIALAPVVTLQAFLVPKLILFSWLLSSVALILLPKFPVISMKPDIRLVALAGYLWFFSNGLYIYYRKVKQQNKIYLITTMFTIGLALWNVISVDSALSNKEDPKKLNYILSWFLLAVVPFMPLVNNANPVDRLIHICLNLSIPFILLSVRQEPITLYFICMYLVTWVMLELHFTKMVKNEAIMKENLKLKITMHDLRRGLLFYFYIIVSFFAIGNVDHMSTFEIDWVRCFVNELEVVVIACLIIYKNAIVIMLTLCAVITICEQTQTHTDGVFIWFLFLNNIVGFYFFLMVQGYGTVGEISYSLAHHIFAQAIAIITMILYLSAKCLTKMKMLEAFGTLKVKVRDKYRTHFPTTNI